ncbi:hypothetical protein FHG66_00090 [Rubellimicrobium rubrum]|uniref:DUF3617 family protein n=1 Tax=Rubellimicrobium rubrum TaxID=2585369 RepID=A0A5C4N439_9RHOB|nr:hypothetical protein [Rubellimicrobium rubrum]TNC52735.1 hypothetical protein FHG66_00090 [Rubellimicrobium rubrum]
MRALALLLLPIAAQAQTLADTHFTMNFCYEVRLDAGSAVRPQAGLRSLALTREPAGSMHSLGTTPVQVRATFFGDGQEYRALASCSPDRDGLECRMEDEGDFRLDGEGEAVRLSVGEDGMGFGSVWSDGQRLEPAAEAAPLVLRRCG